jgi:hypothetical protein
MEEYADEIQQINGSDTPKVPGKSGKGLFFAMLFIMMVVFVLLLAFGKLSFKNGYNTRSGNMVEYYYLGEWKNEKSLRAGNIRIRSGSQGMVFTIMNRQIDLKTRFDNSEKKLQVYLSDADSIAVELDAQRDVLVVPGEGEYHRLK